MAVEGRDGMDAGLGYGVGWESNGRRFDDYGSNCGSRNGMQVDNTLSAAPDKNKQCGSGLEEAAWLVGGGGGSLEVVWGVMDMTPPFAVVVVVVMMMLIVVTVEQK